MSASQRGSSQSAPWWQRPGLGYQRSHLTVAGHSLEALAARHGTPLYVYDLGRVVANLQRLRQALAELGTPHRVFYALKSNRHPDVLAALRQAGIHGLDTCSPGEVDLARGAGFAANRISFTGTSLSDRDLDRLLKHPDLILNCDSIHDLERVAERAPGHRVGLRINPGLGIGYRRNRMLRYAGGSGTKFGLHREQFTTALRIARRRGLVVEGLHFHTGCGFLTPQLPVLDKIFRACRWFVDQLPALRYLNVGGGLGIPLVPEDAALDLTAWTALLRRHWAGAATEIWSEPGDYLVKDAGVLVLEANTVETKGTTRYVGVNGGFSVHPEPAFYDLPLWPVSCRAPQPRGRLETVTIAGNINEALDILHADARLPRLANGDLLAFLNAGGYGAAMASNHCLRGDFTEIAVPPAAR